MFYSGYSFENLFGSASCHPPQQFHKPQLDNIFVQAHRIILNYVISVNWDLIELDDKVGLLHDMYWTDKLSLIYQK